MLATLVTIGILLSGALASIIWPIHLPAGMLDVLDVVYGAIWRLDGYVPVEVFMDDLGWFVTILVAKKIFNLAVGLVAMVSGGGKPEL